MDIEFCTVGPHPEDVLPLPDGSVVTGLDDGRVMRVGPDFKTVTEIANTGGRPLGLDLMPDGRIVICDVELGIWVCDPDTGALNLLADHYQGERLNFCNNPCVADDGSIWFSTSTIRYGMDDYLLDIVEDRPSGRLFRYMPGGELICYLDGLAFGNGVVVTPDQTQVLVAETGHGDIRSVQTDGAEPRQAGYFAQRIPGFPDNMSVTPDGKLMVAQVTRFTDDLRKLHDLPFALRWLIPRLPAWMQPKPDSRIMLGLYDFDGTELAQLDTHHPDFDTVTGARMAGDWIYLGTIAHDKIARIPRSALFD